MPVPASLLETLVRFGAQKDGPTSLWSWSRAAAYRRVKHVMLEAGIHGVHASPKGLRHGFGVACVERNIPLNMIQKWLGHAQLATTAIYLNAVGEEERRLAARLWK